MNAECGPYAPKALPGRSECRAITNGCIEGMTGLTDSDVRRTLTDEEAWKNGSFENVIQNFRRFAEAAGFRAEDIVCSDQTHTTNVLRVGRADSGSGSGDGKNRSLRFTYQDLAEWAKTYRRTQ